MKELLGRIRNALRRAAIWAFPWLERTGMEKLPPTELIEREKREEQNKNRPWI